MNRTTIENVVAEIGADMSQFPDEHHLSSWAGISPENEESGRQTATQPHDAEKPLASPGDHRSGLGGRPNQEQLPRCPVPPSGGRPGQEVVLLR